MQSLDPESAPPAMTAGQPQQRERCSMSEADPAGLTSIPLTITDPERIPAGRYYDAEFFELEKERLWPHVWQMACRLETIPDVGDWIEYTNSTRRSSSCAPERREGVPQRLPPSRRSLCRRYRARCTATAARQKRLRLSVPRLALGHERQQHARFRQAAVQRASDAGRGPQPGAVPGRYLGRLRLHQSR